MSSGSVPNSLADLRKRRGWSQAALAEHSGISRTEVSGIETGRLVPSVALALRLAQALNEPVERVFSAPRPDAAAWAWPAETADTRCWWSAVNDRVLAYPVEHTAAGSIPHDDIAAPQPAQPGRTLIVAGC